MGRLSEESIQQVIAASDIVAVVQSYLPLRKAGTAYKATCPFHSERTPSFQVNPSRQIFKCFGCGAGGNVIKFVELYEHVTFVEAVRRLAERAGIALAESESSAEELGAFRQRKELLALHRAIGDWFHQLLLTDRQAEPARRYWTSRGLDGQAARRWKIGFAPADPALVLGWAREQSIRDDLLAEGGFMLFTDTDGRRRREPWFRFAGRLMFPIHNEQGEVIAFSGRLLDPEAQAAKYLNSPETPIFNKSRVIFGLDRARRPITREKRAVICEGQLDLITCVEAGIDTMVAPLGTAFTEHHARRLHQLADEIILCFDSDAAGVKAAGRAFALLARQGAHVRVAELPPGDDPDSLVRRDGAEALRSLLDKAPDYFNFHLGHLTRHADLTQVRERLRIAADLASGIACLNEKAAQEDAINRTATRLAIPPGDIRTLVVRAARETARHHHYEQIRSHHENGAADGRPESGATQEPVLPANRTVVLLCRLLLMDAEARTWLRSVDGRWLQDVAGTDFLRRLLDDIDFNPAEPASTALFLASLNPAENEAAHRLLADTTPSTGAAEARAAYHKLKEHWLRGKIDQIKARQQSPGLAPQEILSLAQEEIELRRQVHESTQAAALARLPSSLAPF